MANLKHKLKNMFSQRGTAVRATLILKVCLGGRSGYFLLFLLFWGRGNGGGGVRGEKGGFCLNIEDGGGGRSEKGRRGRVHTGKVSAKLRMGHPDSRSYLLQRHRERGCLCRCLMLASRPS